MAQTTILLEGNTAGQASSDVTIVAGDIAAVGMFATGGLLSDAACYIYMDTPQADVLIDSLRPADPVKMIAGPCTIRVVRKSGNLGVFSET
jgi:hypothetical protein